jgi:hypothetical protein
MINRYIDCHLLIRVVDFALPMNDSVASYSIRKTGNTRGMASRSKPSRPSLNEDGIEYVLGRSSSELSVGVYEAGL